MEGGLCRACRETTPAFTAARSWAVYEGPVREAVHRLKYKRDLGLGEALAASLYKLLASLDWQLDLVTPVPLGIARFRERGYNQAAFIAFPLALMAGLPYSSTALRKVRDTRSQVELSLTERRANIRRAFQAKHALVTGKSILVVDDVMTSGATLNECSTALLEAGASQVFCLSFARAVHRVSDGSHIQ